MWGLQTKIRLVKFAKYFYEIKKIKECFPKIKEKRNKKNYCSLPSTVVAGWWQPPRGPSKVYGGHHEPPEVYSTMGPPKVHGGHHRTVRGSWQPPRGLQRFMAASPRLSEVHSNHRGGSQKFLTATAEPSEVYSNYFLRSVLFFIL